MKTAEKWIREWGHSMGLGYPNGERAWVMVCAKDIKRVQADALRHAAAECKRLSALNNRNKMAEVCAEACEYEADKLEGK